MSVILREYRAEDFAALASWQNDRETTRYLSTRYWIPMTESDCRAEFQKRLESSHNAYYFVAASTADESYLGEVRLYNVDWRLRSASAGLVILPARRGLGAGREALKLLCGFAFQTLGLERVELEAHTDNLPALRCYEAAGFTREGLKRHAFYNDGAFHDVVLMSMIRDDWQAKG